MKRAIPSELKDKCVEIYQEVLFNKQPDAVAVVKIKDLCKASGEEISERTIYRYLEEWKKSLTVSSVVQSYDIDLSEHSEIAKDAMRRFYKRFTTEDDKEKPDYRAISQWATHLKEFLGISTNIEVLKSKKTTQASTNADTAKIVMIEE